MHQRLRLQLNVLPTTQVDLETIAMTTPCMRTAAAIYMHIDEAWARRCLRGLQGGAPDHVNTSTERMRRHLLYAVRRQNAAVMPVDHVHAVFTRPKANGRELRLIVDCTDKNHPNSFNCRLPKQAAPPGMFRVPTVVAVVMSGTYFGLDDVKTAFATMGMCRTMCKALGMRLAETRYQPAMTMSHTRMPQGGTWSATVCQGHTLTAAVPALFWPASNVPDDMRLVGVPRDAIGQLPAANWEKVLIALRRVVHVDDVVSVGLDPAIVDAARRQFRENATQKYGVQWKDAEPAKQLGVALGILFDLGRRTWGVSRTWSVDVMDSLRGWDSNDEEDQQWLRGVLAWVCQVLHVPKVIMMLTIDGAKAPKWTESLLRARISYVRELELPDRLTSWPRDGDRQCVQLSDASTYGWGGSLLDIEASACRGNWYRCERIGFSPFPCCAGSEAIRLVSGQIAHAEAIASTLLIHRTPTGVVGRMVLTDSQAWRDAVARSGSADPVFAALLVFIWMVSDGQIATAHVQGEENDMDGPSRPNGATTVLRRIPPHSRPMWSLMGSTRRCRHVAIPAYGAVRGSMPCFLIEACDRALKAADECACEYE